MSTQQVNTNAGSTEIEGSSLTDAGAKMGSTTLVMGKATESASATGTLAAYNAGVIEDEIKAPDGTTVYSRVDNVNGNPIINLDENRAINIKESNCLLYKDGNNNYILEFEGKIIHLTNDSSYKVYDSQKDLDEYLTFLKENNIDEQTVLGSKIILKQIMSNMGYSFAQLDEMFFNPQSDHLALVNQIIMPVVEANLSTNLSSLKSLIDLIKKIVQKSTS